jgi:hypothetical protein
MMNVMISERLGRKDQQKRTRDDEDEDREMKECLVRLKAWQTENLMAPHGLDRFAESGKDENRKNAQGKGRWPMLFSW